MFLVLVAMALRSTLRGGWLAMLDGTLCWNLVQCMPTQEMGTSKDVVSQVSIVHAPSLACQLRLNYPKDLDPARTVQGGRTWGYRSVVPNRSSIASACGRAIFGVPVGSRQTTCGTRPGAGWAGPPGRWCWCGQIARCGYHRAICQYSTVLECPLKTMLTRNVSVPVPSAASTMAA